MKNGVRFVNSESDLRASYQLRHKVYVEGMGRFSDRTNHELKELKDNQDNNARAVIAVKNNAPIGTLRLFWGRDKPFVKEQWEAYHLETFKSLEQNKICIIERLMVDNAHRGSMTAMRMYKEVMNFVVKQKIELVLLDCEPHHLEAYLKLGFKPFAKQYNYPGVGPVIPMVLIVADYDHLTQIGSPFAMLLSRNELHYCQQGLNALRKIITTDINNDHSPTFNKRQVIIDFCQARKKILAKRSEFFDIKFRSKLCVS